MRPRRSGSTAPLHAVEGVVAERRVVHLTEAGLTTSDLVAVADAPATVVLSAEVAARISAGRARLQGFIESDCTLYGLTTGFGPLAGRAITSADAPVLQRRLIHHLATGVGTPLSWRAARAVCVARLCCLARGYSGAGEAAVDALRRLLASPLAPLIPSQGTVGASGDLTPLAHVALALMGEGDFLTVEGDVIVSREAFALLGAEPLVLTARDGLALVNGTAAMTGIAALNHDRAVRLVAWAEALGVGLGEVLAARAEAWDPAFGAVRPHAGQKAAHAALQTLSRGAERLRRRPLAESMIRQDVDLQPEPSKGSARVIPPPPQDAYTLRCLPQITGAARDVLSFHGSIVTRELNATTDNPILPETAQTEMPTALHGGNFMGQHVAFAADALSTAVLSVAGLAERQIARVTDERLSGDLPPFLTRGQVGLDSGLMGAQVTATALLAEMRSRAVPASVLSISTNGANQDVVSMGTIAARATDRHLDDAFAIMAILALAVAQGVDIRRGEDDARAFGPATETVVAEIRRRAPPLIEDRPLSREIAVLAEWLDETSPWDLVPGLVAPRDVKPPD